MLAHTMGWRATVATAHASVTTHERFSAADEVLSGPADALRVAVDRCARPLAVVMSHDYERDRACLAALLESHAQYIGVLGPARRTQRMLAELSVSGTLLGDAALARVHAPVGLDLGAETPAEIALAIVAEAQATLTGARAVSLRHHPGPIHGPSAARQPVCAILAAGASRRLGRAKQLLSFGGKPLVRHVADVVALAACAEVAVVVGAEDDAVRGALEGARATIAHNAQWREGIASSIRCAVAWAMTREASALVV